MGVLDPGSAHARPSAQPPIDTSGNLSVHVSAKSTSNIFPQPLRKPILANKKVEIHISGNSSSRIVLDLTMMIYVYSIKGCSHYGQKMIIGTLNLLLTWTLGGTLLHVLKV